MQTDDEIIQDVIRGRTDRYEAILKRYQHSLLNFIHKMVQDRDEAENLSQDVFVKVFSSLRKYHRQGNFRAFLFTVAKNMSLNHLKRQRRNIPLSWIEKPGMENTAFQLSPEQDSVYDQEHRDRLLLDALKSLRENQRIALILKIYLEFSYKQISQITGWSVPKIETLISRAKRNLQAWLQVQEREKNRVNIVRGR